MSVIEEASARRQRVMYQSYIYMSIRILGSQLAPTWVMKMVVYNHWTGTNGLGWYGNGGIAGLQFWGSKG